ncbi:glycoside hydrolase family 66 protein [Bacillaceae bacterium S4-13-58]
MIQKLNIIWLMILITIFLLLGMLFLVINRDVSFTNSVNLAQKGDVIQQVSLDQSMYNPGEVATITTELSNEEDGKEFRGKLVYRIYHLDQLVDTLEKEFAFQESQIEVAMKWKTPEEDFKGYLVEVWLLHGKEHLDKVNTAIDVSSTWSKFPRYGYLVDFGKATNQELSSRVQELNKYHMNGLQFYDWHDKHHQPLPSESKWEDIARRPIQISSVKGYIKALHNRNMMAMNYNLMFGSYKDSQDDGVLPEWGLYKDPNHNVQDHHPLPNSWETNKLLLENPSSKGWRDYILTEEQKVFDVIDFDGWHIDQLGDRGRLYDFDGNIVDLKSTYQPFLQEAKSRLNKLLVINAVNQYGQFEIASSPVEFLYTEVWPPAITSYGQLKQVIDMGNRLSQGEKNMVLAAYMNYRLADRSGEFNLPSVLMTDSVIFASGGSHLELGDTGMLGMEYFPNENLKMSPELKQELQQYYHFLVAYENVLRDGVENIDREVTSDQIDVKKYPSKESVWSFTKEKEGYEILHLINFSNYKFLAWRDDFGNYPEPQELQDFQLKYYTNSDVEHIFMASPNLNQGSMMELKFSKGKDAQGPFLSFKVPSLKYWDMIYMKTNYHEGE